MSQEGTLSDLIEALNIFLRYGDMRWPTICSHDKLLVCFDPQDVSEVDKQRLDCLGFHAGDDHFYSFVFGSA